MAKAIPLSQGQETLVDDVDYEWLSAFKWYAQWNQCTRSFYACRSVRTGLDRPRQRQLRMHRAIWERHDGPIPTGRSIDHIDRDSLNNRRANLRPATRSQQVQNQGVRKDNLSGYRGVRKMPLGNWQARIAVGGHKLHLGTYDDPIQAARAYDAAARRHHGEFAQLNFP